MKIVQICTNAMSGSVGRIARTLITEALNQKNEILLCYGRGNNPSSVNSYRIDKKIEVYCHVAKARVLDMDGLGSEKATVELINRLILFNPDIVHIHCLHGYYINYPILFKYFKDKNIKVVWTMHDCWAYTGHCAYYSYRNCQKWKENCGNCFQKRSYPKSLAIDNSRSNLEKKKEVFLSLKTDNMTIVSPSQWLAEELKSSFLKKYPIEVINNGVSEEFLKDISYKKYNKKTILGVANVWDDRKGLQDFIELSKILPDNIQIIVVGVSEKQMQLLKNYRIKAYSRTSSLEELIHLYAASTVLFNPTYEDNYPTVNLEAIACGLPVVTYDTGGSKEIVQKTGYGLVIEKKDFESLISYVLDLNSNEYQPYREKIINCKNMVNSYFELYNELLRKKNGTIKKD